MQDELNSGEENVILDKTVSLKVNNETLLTLERMTPLGVTNSIQYTVDEDYPEKKLYFDLICYEDMVTESPSEQLKFLEDMAELTDKTVNESEKKLYLDLMSNNVGTEVLIKRYEFFLEDMTKLAGKTFIVHISINKFHVFFLTVIEGKLAEEVNYTKLIYQFDRVQIPTKNNKKVIKIQQGATVFERGFVMPGRVTPGNTRIISTCESCSNSFLYRMYHVGFSEVDYYYCDSCTNYLAVSLWDEKYKQLLDKLTVKRIEPFSQLYDFSEYEIQLNLENYRLIEDQFMSCTCGGRFRFLANCLCPFCKTPYIDFFNDLFRKADHYYVVEMIEPKAESFYGESTWKEDEDADFRGKLPHC